MGNLHDYWPLWTFFTNNLLSSLPARATATSPAVPCHITPTYAGMSPSNICLYPMVVHVIEEVLQEWQLQQELARHTARWLPQDDSWIQSLFTWPAISWRGICRYKNIRFDLSLTHYGFGKLYEKELGQFIEIELGQFIPREWRFPSIASFFSWQLWQRKGPSQGHSFPGFDKPSCMDMPWPDSNSIWQIAHAKILNISRTGYSELSLHSSEIKCQTRHHDLKFWMVLESNSTFW